MSFITLSSWCLRGLRLAEWQPPEDVVPEAIMALVQQRQHVRAEKRWKDADTLRKQVRMAGYDIEDTPQGPRVCTLERRDREPENRQEDREP
jgi:cysteinyl-tRNA synthetase